MIEMSPTIAKVATAVALVQQAVDGVVKDSKNPAFKSTYASLESVVSAIREHYLQAGLVVMQGPGEVTEAGQMLTTLIVHCASGEWIKNTAQIPLGKRDPQGAGSALTYIERYSQMGLFNLPPVDDDAETATAPVRQPAKPRAVEPAPPAPPPGPVSSGSVRGRLLDAMNKQITRTLLSQWSENDKVKEAINGLSEADEAFFRAAYRKRWNDLPESQAMAG